MSTGPSLRLDRVHVWRGERHVLRGVSLDLDAGELLHISGPNGSGKTTLLRVICGLQRPEQGQVCWSGQPIARIRAQYHDALAYASHEPALKADLTAMENLRFAVGLKRGAGAKDLLAALSRTGAAGCADLPARVLSAGQRRRVAMARVLAMRARLWLLDEPYTNLDAAGADVLASLLQEHVEHGGLGVVVAHHALELQLERGIRRMELS